MASLPTAMLYEAPPTGLSRFMSSNGNGIRLHLPLWRRNAYRYDVMTDTMEAGLWTLWLNIRYTRASDGSIQIGIRKGWARNG